MGRCSPVVGREIAPPPRLELPPEALFIVPGASRVRGWDIDASRFLASSSTSPGVPGGCMMRVDAVSHRRYRGRDVLREDLVETRLRCLNGLILVPLLAVIRLFPLLP